MNPPAPLPSLYPVKLENWPEIGKVLLGADQIAQRLTLLAEEITQDYTGKPLTVLALLKGSFILFADLLRHIPLRLQVECISVSSYHGTTSTGRVFFDPLVLARLTGRDVLILDDIYDTGQTLCALREAVQQIPGVQSVRACVLLDKKVSEKKGPPPEYTGFVIENEFVVGYGLDYNEQYRNLPFIATLRLEAFA